MYGFSSNPNGKPFFGAVMPNHGFPSGEFWHNYPSAHIYERNIRSCLVWKSRVWKDVGGLQSTKNWCVDERHREWVMDLAQCSVCTRCHTCRRWRQLIILHSSIKTTHTHKHKPSMKLSMCDCWLKGIKSECGNSSLSSRCLVRIQSNWLKESIIYANT